MSAIFLDRDGVLNRERADYVKSWDEFEFLPGALEALRRLSVVPRPIVVITNQSVIGRGLVDRSTIDAIHERMLERVRTSGGRIDEIVVCPHHPEDGCACRKPGVASFHRSASRHGARLNDSWFVGDSITDYQAAVRAGCGPLMVRTGRQGTRLPELLPTRHHDHLVDDIGAATDRILRSTGTARPSCPAGIR